MKRCPECASGFPDTDQFCERDGTLLVADYWDNYPKLPEPPAVANEFQDPKDVPRARDLSVRPADRYSQEGIPPEVVGAASFRVSPNAQPGQTWKIFAIVAIAAMATGIVLLVGYRSMTNEDPEQNSNASSSNEALTNQQAPLLNSRPSPTVSESPSPEPSPSPSVAPSPVADTARVPLSSSPVSTGGEEHGKRGPIMISLTNGTTVEAEEVWETGEGIWYRHRGVVSLLERDKVKAIERPIEKASPAPASSASPTPSANKSP